VKRYPRRAFRVLAILVLLALASAARALTADLVSTEVTAFVRPDGAVELSYRFEWTASGGEMHGFYFQGERSVIGFNAEKCFADLPSGERVPLSITDMGAGKYDVVLAGGRGFRGKAYYFLSLAADFLASGSLARTESAEHGELAVFSWSPVAFEYSMEHRTVDVVLPVKVASEDLPLSPFNDLGILTEPFVNEENLVDCRGSKGDDGYYFTARFHDDSVAAYDEQPIAFYIPLAKLPTAMAEAVRAGKSVEFAAGSSGSGGAAAPTTGGSGSSSYSAYSDDRPRDMPGRFRRNPAATVIPFAAVLAIVVAAIVSRQRKFAKAAAMVEGIAWAGDSWSPPKLFSGSYQVPGKIAEGLHPAEVAILLELPLPRVAAIMVDALERQGIVQVLENDPRRIKILSAAKASHEYEEAFLASFDPEGRVLSGLMADFFEKVIAKLQEKAWDCDLEATRAHYRKKLQEAEKTAKDQAAATSTASTSTLRRRLDWLQKFAAIHASPDAATINTLA